MKNGKIWKIMTKIKMEKYGKMYMIFNVKCIKYK